MPINEIAHEIGYSTTVMWSWYREGFLPSPVAKQGKALIWNRSEIKTFCRIKRFVHAFSV